MNPKIQKLRNELAKNEEKIRKLEARNTELKQQIREMEDIDIVASAPCFWLQAFGSFPHSSPAHCGVFEF